MTPPETMRQEAPYPTALAALVARLSHRPGWEVTLEDRDRGQGSKGLTLCVLVETVDSYDHANPIRVMHYHIVPAASYDTRSWRRWLFERLRDVDTHEAMEFFTVGGDKPYAPSHGEGNDCYLIREVGTDLDRRTSFRGEITQRFTLRLDDGLWECAACGAPMHGSEMKHKPGCTEMAV